VSEALMRVYGPEFTKKTKSEETVVFTSGLIYKYTRIKSQYSKEKCQQSKNVPEGTRVMTRRLQKRMSQTDEN
jgi:hypothetical protein